MAIKKPKYYWDACMWISLINDRESIRGQCCKYVLDLARADDCEIWTSSFCLAEVYKRKCDTTKVGLEQDQDAYFEELIEHEFVKKVSVDVDVGKVARRLLRKFPKIGKPQDAIHVATCLLENLDEFHTFDGVNLLSLNQKIPRFDGGLLRICMPPYPPADDQVSLFPHEI